MDCRFKRTCIATVRCLLIAALVSLSSATFAQRTISGTVNDENGYALPGVTVVSAGTTIGTITDIDGNFILNVANDATQLQFSFIGYETQTVDVPANGKLVLKMTPSLTEIGEVVAIGYGTGRKGDLTGSVASVSEKDFNGGVVGSAEQLINGKVAGLSIVSSGGSPSAGSTIRVRGGASLNASNNPLIVLDGVPLENGGISGNDNNFLSLINPADIESMTVLKDASSTAIYGSRASNGVIIITTKKGTGNGSKKFKINFNTTNSVSTLTKTPDMLSASQFKDVVNTAINQGYINSSLASSLYDGNTDWNDEVYNNAFGTDNNISVAGVIKGFLPFRASVGYYNQDGILTPDNVTRYTGNLNLSPVFINKSLKVNLSLKASINDNTFANSSGIWGAETMNPTAPVYSSDSNYRGYFEDYTTNADGTLTKTNGATTNPVGLADYYQSTSTVKRLISNLDLEYTLPMLPELKLHAMGGVDFARGEGEIYCPADAYLHVEDGGRDYSYGPQKNKNELFTGYMNYNKSFSTNYTLDATLGYDYQYWNSNTPAYTIDNIAGESKGQVAASDYSHALMSYYGRLNMTFYQKFMVTATVRRDGTSRFSSDERWGTFPSVALGYRITEESFLKDISWLSNLKIRASYGITGQQDGIGNYNYMPLYTISESTAYYQWGNQYVYTYRPSAYVSDLKWETTKSYNLGLDFGFLSNKINGSIEYYTRKTEDLLATVPCAAGTNFTTSIMTNVGNVKSQGFEMTLNLIPIDTKDWTLNLSFNATWDDSEISNLSLVDNGEIVSTLAGSTIDAYQFEVLAEGYKPYAYSLYHQLYDTDGNPIEGAYADLDNDGQITEADRYYGKNPSPDWMFGFSASLKYQKWTLSTSLRSYLNNYVYNGTAMNMGAYYSLNWGNGQQLNNLSTSVLNTKFTSRQQLSDYYLENASFLKMDNISLSYNFGKLFNVMSLNATFSVQNVFTITNYSGADPEIQGGIDNNFYPRPRVYALSLGFQF